MSLFNFSVLRIKCANAAFFLVLTALDIKCGAKVHIFFHICKNKMRTTLFFLPIWQFFARALVHIKTFL